MLGGGSTITLFHVRGIRVAVDWSWFLVLFLVIFWLSRFYGDVLGEESSSSTPFVLALVSAVGFFGSIVLHELGHAIVAMRNGIGITSIQLWIFGGVARMDRESDSPGTEFKVAIAGPAVTLAIVVVLTAVGLAAIGPSAFWDAVLIESGSGVSGVWAMVGWLASINLLVLVFNLLPAFPMDGGRVVRAIAWWRTGDRSSATRFAASLGRVFGYLFIGGGILMIANGMVFGGVWLALIGFVINGSARAASVQTAITGRIEGVLVSDVMDREPVAIPGELSVERALDEYFLRYRWPWFPVVDEAHRFLGLLVRDRADEVPEVSRSTALVSDLLEGDDGLYQVRDDAPLDTLLGNQNLRRFGALMAVDADGRLSGVITAEQVGRALRDSRLMRRMRRLALAAFLVGSCVPAVSGAETIPATTRVEAMPWQPAAPYSQEGGSPVGPAAGRSFNVAVETGGYCAGEREPRIHHVAVVERPRIAGRPFKSAVLTIYVEWPDRPPVPRARGGRDHEPTARLLCAGLGWGASAWVALQRPARDLILYDGSTTPPRRAWPKAPHVRSPPSRTPATASTRTPDRHIPGSLTYLVSRRAAGAAR